MFLIPFLSRLVDESFPVHGLFLTDFLFTRSVVLRQWGRVDLQAGGVASNRMNLCCHDDYPLPYFVDYLFIRI